MLEINNKAKFLKIWLFPKKRNLKPAYHQKTSTPNQRQNKFQVIASPNARDGGIGIYKDACFSTGNFKEDFKTSYNIKENENGVFAFLIIGTVTINGLVLYAHDGLGIWNTINLDIKGNAASEILLMDVLM
jgi:redox-sensitive bicupin YhaK (pirin superfamily)